MAKTPKLPRSKKLSAEARDLLRIELAHDRELAVGGAVEIGVAPPDLRQGERLEPGAALVERGRVEPVLGRVRVQVAGEREARERARIASLRIDAGERGAAQLLELFIRKRRLAQYLGHQPQGLGKALAHGFDRAPVAADAHVRLEPVESVAQLLAGILLRAAQQHPARDAAGCGAVQLALLVAPSQGELRSEERRVGKECRSRWSPYH